MNFSKVKICILDVNGVLIDSNMANALAMGQTFSDDPVLREKIAAFYLTLTGIDRGEKIRRVQHHIIKRPFGENEFERLWEKLKSLTRISMGLAARTRGCKQILNALADRGITRVALSNTPVDELRHILAEQELESHLEIIRGGGNWPKIESLQRVINEFEFSPQDCLFIADGKGDLWAARAAGVPFVAIDPDTGEFEKEKGFDGPFHTLWDWAENAGLI